jgi:DNA-binding transcriptional LysR family regulator
VDFKTLNAFYLTISTGSTLRAASLMELTVPTLSVKLKNLEKDLKVRLFNRLPNKLVPTPEGMAFYGEVRQVLEGIERAKAAVHRKQGHSFDGRISISMGSDLIQIFAPRLGSFLKRHPRLQCTLLARASSETLSLVLAGNVDIGIGRFDSMPRTLIAKDLFENSIWCSFPRKHPFARNGRISVGDFESHRIITLTRSSGTGRAIDQVFRRSRVRPQNILEVGSCRSALEFVKLGVGIGLVHNNCLITERKDNLRFKDVSHIFGAAPVTLIYKRSTILTPAHLGIMDIFTHGPRGHF